MEVGKLRTSFIPESTEMQDMVSLECIVPGKASQKARMRLRARVSTFLMITASADG
jgi:hypothetical protein